MNQIAFFDFDGTLTRHDTFIEFAKFSVGRGAFLKALLKSGPSLVMWKLGMRSNSEAKQRLFSNLYKGMDYNRFKALCNEFAEYIEGDTRQETFDIMLNHKNEGRSVIIVSASIADWILPWAEAKGVDKVIATEIEADSNGIITGRFLTPNCHGLEKENRIRAMFPQVSRYETWAYGDSSGDNAMLAMVNHPNRV